MTIGQTIKLYRKEKNFTQSELAELIGVSTQAISKWETDSGMPDISQIVPLARVLEISTDKLLGHTDSAFEKEVTEIRQKFGGINFINDLNYAQELYVLTSKFFNKHPDVSDIAVVALETYIELFAKGKINVSKSEFLEECERYGNSIFRYGTVADRIYKTHYLMSRAYDLCGDNKKAKSYLQNLPYVFGFRDYWEAEIAFADGKNDIALEKVKKSFAQMARFTSRCIRLAGRVVRAEGKPNADEISLQLDEYMLRLINAFLSGGDYLPHRQIFQKTCLLPGLVSQNIKLGNLDKAKEHMQELIKTRDEFFACVDNPNDKHCLMFIEGDLDGSWNTTKEKINERVSSAEKALKQIY